MYVSGESFLPTRNGPSHLLASEAAFRRVTQGVSAPEHQVSHLELQVSASLVVLVGLLQSGNVKVLPGFLEVDSETLSQVVCELCVVAVLCPASSVGRA